MNIDKKNCMKRIFKMRNIFLILSIVLFLPVLLIGQSAQQRKQNSIYTIPVKTETKWNTSGKKPDNFGLKSESCLQTTQANSLRQSPSSRNARRNQRTNGFDSAHHSFVLSVQHTAYLYRSKQPSTRPTLHRTRACNYYVYALIHILI